MKDSEPRYVSNTGNLSVSREFRAAQNRQKETLK